MTAEALRAGRIVVLSGGVGGARFIEGVVAARPEAEVTVVANTADDIWLFGLRVCPDLDSIMYALGGGIDPERRWGRADETWNARAELEAYGVDRAWFGLGDRDLATHLVRTLGLRSGAPLSRVTEGLCERWRPGVRLLPMSDEEVETHLRVTVNGASELMHFQEFWIRHRAALPFTSLEYRGIADARPAPGVLDAIARADVVLLAPSNPVVSIGPILALPSLAGALRSTAAPVVGVSPIVAGGHVRGMADQLFEGLGLENSAAAVAERYGARPAGVLDGWLVDEADDAAVARLGSSGIVCRAVPLYMRDRDTTLRLASDALALAEHLAQSP